MRSLRIVRIDLLEEHLDDPGQICRADKLNFRIASSFSYPTFYVFALTNCALIPILNGTAYAKLREGFNSERFVLGDASGHRQHGPDKVGEWAASRLGQDCLLAQQNG